MRILSLRGQIIQLSNYCLVGSRVKRPEVRMQLRILLHIVNQLIRVHVLLGRVAMVLGHGRLSIGESGVFHVNLDFLRLSRRSNYGRELQVLIRKFRIVPFLCFTPSVTFL